MLRRLAGTLLTSCLLVLVLSTSQALAQGMGGGNPGANNPGKNNPSHGNRGAARSVPEINPAAAGAVVVIVVGGGVLLARRRRR